MKSILAMCICLLATPAMASDPSAWKVATVHDGDTFEVIVPDLPAPLQRVGIRVMGVDAPEMAGRASCASERVLANQAREFTRRFLAGGQLRLEDLAWDKYGGRIDARVLVNGKDLAPALIAAGLGNAYSGEGKRKGWCR
jgi:endonuclease YncB( thermonuclease family)